MKRIIGFTASVLAFVGALSIASAAVNMEDGNWEIQMETSVESGSRLPGLGGKLSVPGVPTGSTTVNQCLTQKDLVPASASKDQKCEVKNVRIAGNTVTWSVTCTIEKGGTLEGDGEIAYSGSSMNGAIKNRISPKDGKPVTSTVKLTGKKTGPCAK